MAKGTKKTESNANLGFEAKLWLSADKLRNNMDAAEYKHVVLGLIFLKYISDTFDEHHAKLKEGKGDFKGANPEDKDEYLAANVFWVPMDGSLARDWSCGQRASTGTQKTLAARYSSLSSGFAPLKSPSPAASLAWCSSKVSEMYLRKMRPRTTCLYSAASMLLRSLSAASQSLASKPRLAEESLEAAAERFFAMQ